MAPLTGSGTHLHWPWLAWLLATVVLGLLLLWARGPRRRTPTRAAYVAHAARLRGLPRYRTLVRRRTALGAAISLAALVACSGAIVLAGRPQATLRTEQSTSSRDIMLCLDSSASMIAIDGEVLAQFQDIVRGLHGDRVGLTIWNGTAVTVFPLTDDYAFILDQLTQARQAFAGPDLFGDAYQQFTAGTVIPQSKSSSQAGDGLASCVQRFDRTGERRSRAIVLATDNQPFGPGIFTLPQAAAYAAKHHIVVHGICAPTTAQRPLALDEFRSSVLSTGGTFSLLDSGNSVATVVDAISALVTSRITKPPVLQTVDHPHVGTVVTGLGIGLLVVVWLVEGLLVLLDREGERG